MPKLYSDTRGMILKAAREEAKEKGLNNISVRSISERSGLGLGTFYNYFENKKELVSTMMSEDWLVSESKLIKDAEDVDSNAYFLVQEMSESVRDFFKKNQEVLISCDSAQVIPFYMVHRERILNSLVHVFIHVPNITCPDDELPFYAYSIIGYAMGGLKLPFGRLVEIINEGLFRPIQE